MSDLLAQIQAQLHRESHPVCPHCKGEIDMTDCERASPHTSYWGEDEAVEDNCPNCNATIYVTERVRRSWIVGRTSEEAWEL